MRILVIGGNRFMGFQFVWRALLAGHILTVVNRGSVPDPFRGRVEALVADRRSPAFAEAVRGRAFDAAVDFAAYGADDVTAMLDAFPAGAIGHYVMISTGQVYLVREGCAWPAREGDYDGPVMSRPDDPRQHGDWQYGVDKRAAEDLLDRAWQDGRLASTRLRIPMVNGERDPYRRLDAYLWRILDGGPLLLPAGGARRIRPVYSLDVADAILALLGHADAFGQAYNLSQREIVSVRELVEAIAARVGASPRIVPVAPSALAGAGLEAAGLSPFDHAWSSLLDPSLAEARLGFAPTPFERYLDRIVAASWNRPDGAPPQSYAGRAAEIDLAGRLT